jgi:hypothetical protein
MPGIKPITSYFKLRSKDELEVEELEEDRLAVPSTLHGTIVPNRYSTVATST